MLLSLAELEPELAHEATAEADATIEEAVAAMYVEGEGVWACIYPNGTRSDLIRFEFDVIRHLFDINSI